MVTRQGMAEWGGCRRERLRLGCRSRRLSRERLRPPGKCRLAMQSCYQAGVECRAARGWRDEGGGG